MPVTTAVASYSITVPSTMTINETIHQVTLPGVPADCSGLPNSSYPNPGYGIYADRLKTILKFTGPSTAKVPAYRNDGSHTKLIGRYSLHTPQSSGFCRHGVTKNIGYGLRVSDYGTRDVLGSQQVPFHSWPTTSNPNTGYIVGPLDVVRRFGNQIVDRIVIVPKPSAEDWRSSTNLIYEKTTTSATINSQLSSLTGFTSVRVIGRLVNEPTNGAPGTLFGKITQRAHLDSLTNNLAINFDGGAQEQQNYGVWEDSQIVTFVGNFVNGPAYVGGAMFTSVSDPTMFGSMASSVYVGIVVQFISPNIYRVLTDGYKGASRDKTLKSIIGLDQFSLMHLPGTATNPSFVRGNPSSEKWQNKVIAFDLTDEMTLNERNYGGTPQVGYAYDNMYKTRKYVKAPMIIGSCDGGDFAIDATVPAPFGNLRIVYSPTIRADTYQDAYSAAGDLSSYTYDNLRMKINTLNEGLGELGACIYEPFVVEKVSSVSVPENYTASIKKRPTGRVRSGTNPTTIIQPKQSIRYGGGAFGDGLRNTFPGGQGYETFATDAAVDLWTIPSAASITVIFQPSGAAPATQDVQWALWNAVTESWQGVGGTSTIALTETFNGYARYSGVAPTPPAGNRQTAVRLHIAGAVIGLPVNGYTEGFINYAYYHLRVESAINPIRRRVWPWLVVKNKAIGSDATVVEAENLGAVWADPDPQPALSVTGDWVVTLDPDKSLVFAVGTLVATCTNRALSPEAGPLAYFNQPTCIAVRKKDTDICVMPIFSYTGMLLLKRKFYAPVDYRPLRFPVGTVLIVSVLTVLRWDYKLGRGAHGNSGPANACNRIDQDIACVFEREYEITQT